MSKNVNVNINYFCLSFRSWGKLSSDPFSILTHLCDTDYWNFRLLSGDEMGEVKFDGVFFLHTDLCCCFTPTGALGYWLTWCWQASHLFWEKKSRRPSWTSPRSTWTTRRTSFRASLTSPWISSSHCSSKTPGRGSWLLFVSVDVEWQCPAPVLFRQTCITWLM